MPKKITLTELRQLVQDENTPDEEIAQYLVEDSDSIGAFTPQIRINPKFVDDEGLEADVLMGWFNRADRARRQRRYKRKIRDGWSGLRFVSEGDSWFQYPFLLHDVIDHLSDEYAIFSLGAAGDLVSDMQHQDEIAAAVRAHNPHGLLISGGGNDLLGEGRLATAVHKFKEGRKAADYPNAKFNERLGEVIGIYRKIFTDLLQEFPHLKIICHGYDYAIPNRGRWLGKPLEKLGIKQKRLQLQIIAVLIDRFNDALTDLAGDFPNAVFNVNCRKAVGPKLWFDELHPNRVGYGAVAERFRSVVGAVVDRGENFDVSQERLSPGKEAKIEDAKDLDPWAFRELVVHRGREVLEQEIPTTSSEAERKEVEADISRHFEKISGGADFLPASFLLNGADRAKAVCRVVLPGSVGSGFLVATRDFIMTNNHVIASPEDAETAVAEFGFDNDSPQQQVRLDPSRFFVTDAALDFTIVACDGSELQGITPIPLLRSPTTVTRGERVNIIQHPRGRPKEVALHDNDVHRVKDKVLWYRTDTEPGSSGSPVFNNTWDLVALHHAGWHEPDGTTTNEGVRIASIVSNLTARQVSGTEAMPELFTMLETIPDTSPHLGFFDIVGVTGSSINEIEIPEYRGSADYADIGVWNIEHFNNSITDARVSKVANVVGHLSLDVLGLVEVRREALERLTTQLQLLGHDYAFKYHDVRGGQDLAVLYDRKTSDVVLAQDILNRHREAWEAKTSTGRTAFPRRPLIARVSVIPRSEDKPEGLEDLDVKFILVVVHLKAFGDPESRARRRLASQILAEVIEDIRATENVPVVLGGDMNETLGTDVLDALKKAPDMFTLTSDDHDDNAISYVGATHRSLIDHIIVSNDVKMGSIQGDDAAIVRLDKSVANFTRDISDHVPLVIRMVNRDAPVQIEPDAHPSLHTVDIPDGATGVRFSYE